MLAFLMFDSSAIVNIVNAVAHIYMSHAKHAICVLSAIYLETFIAQSFLITTPSAKSRLIGFRGRVPCLLQAGSQHCDIA